MREETRAGVRRARAEAGHVSDRSAANRRAADAGLVGLVVDDRRTPFFAEFATSAQLAFSARGYAMMIASTDEDAGRRPGWRAR